MGQARSLDSPFPDLAAESLWSVPRFGRFLCREGKPTTAPDGRTSFDHAERLIGCSPGNHIDRTVDGGMTLAE